MESLLLAFAFAFASGVLVGWLLGARHTKRRIALARLAGQ